VKKVVLIQPVWCRVWQWPAVVNLVMGGTAAGLFLTGLIAHPVGADGPGLFPSGLQWVAPVLVLLGFSAVGFEAGRPLSAGYLLHHLHSSWMSREVLVGLVFMVFAGLDALFPTFLFKAVAGFGATALLVCQGIMVNRSRAVTAWNRNIIVLHSLTSGMNLGFGLLLILTPLVSTFLLPEPIWFGVSLLFINFLVWQYYSVLTNEKEFREATNSIRRPKSVVFSVGFGHFVPALFLVTILLVVPPPSESLIFTMMCFLSGASMVLGGIFQKGALLLQANLFREVRAELCLAE
jgi:DMSO reductase anchor subunit